jgi:hypothetical protein
MSNAVENIQRLQRNVRKMIDAGAPETDIDAYLAEEGYTPDSFATANKRLRELGPAKVPDAGFFARAGNSAAFNFGDEAAALSQTSRIPQGVQAAMGPGAIGALALERAIFGGAPDKPTYDQQLAANRMGLDEYARQFPGRALAADVTGALAPAVLTAGAGLPATGARGVAAARAATTARNAPTLLGNVARSGAIGAAEGGLQGLGAAEGGAFEQAKGLGTGALLGAGFGGAFGGLATGGASVYQNLRPRASRTGDDAARYFGNIVAGEGRSLDDITRELAAREAIGVGDNITADVMGPSFRNEMGAAATQQGQLQDQLTAFLNERARGQADRVRGFVSSATGGRIRDTAKAAQAERDAARIAVDPLYAQFRARQPFVNDPVLTQLVSERPALGSAFNQAQQSLLNRGVADPSAFDTVPTIRFDPQTGIGEQVEENIATFSPEMLDRIGKITGASAADVSNRALPAAARNMASDTMAARTDLLRRVDELAPEYAQARQIFADAETFAEQARAGRQFLNADSEDAVAALRAAQTPAEQGAFREGVLDAFGQRLGASQNVAGRINQATPRIADVNTMDRVLDAFPGMRGQPYNQFVQQLDALAQQTSTRNSALGRLQRQSTDPMVQNDAAANATAGELSSLFAQQNANPLAFGALTRGLRQSGEQYLGEVRAAAAPGFLAKGSAEINPWLDAVAKVRAGDEVRDALARRVPGAVAGAAVAPTVAGTSNTAGPAAIGQQFGFNEDTSIGPARADVLRGIEQRQRLIEDPNTPPAEKENLLRQQERMRALIGQ